MHLSGNTYKITIQTYTNTFVTTADRCELMVYFGDGDSASAPRMNGPNALGCASGHDGVMIGACLGPNVKYNVYETTHTFPGTGDYIITMEEIGRAHV